MTSLDLVDPFWVELSALSLPTGTVTLDSRRLTVSDHAVLRYRQRVERLSRRQARRRLVDLVVDTEWEIRPRGWMPIVLHDDTHFGYPTRRLDVCLLERNGVIVTVLSWRFLQQVAPTGVRQAKPPR